MRYTKVNLLLLLLLSTASTEVPSATHLVQDLSEKGTLPQVTQEHTEPYDCLKITTHQFGR